MFVGDSNLEFDDSYLSVRSNVDSIRDANSKVWVNVGDSTKRHASVTYSFPAAMWEHQALASATMGFAGSTYRHNVNVTGYLTRHDPQVVVFMLGTNDAYSGTRTSTQILDTLSALLDSIWAYNDSIKVLLSEIQIKSQLILLLKLLLMLFLHRSQVSYQQADLAQISKKSKLILTEFLTQLGLIPLRLILLLTNPKFILLCLPGRLIHKG
jgi:hypothetical protein